MNARKNPFDYSIRMAQVIYNVTQQKEIVQDVIKKALKDKFENMFIYGAEFKQLSYIFKHPTFFEEKEWRIVNTAMSVGDSMIGGVSRLKCRVNRDSMVSFLELPFNNDKKYIEIKEVVLGPKNKTLPDTLHNYLELNNYFNVRIRPSAVPYR